jgi:hypothetical protein
LPDLRFRLEAGGEEKAEQDEEMNEGGEREIRAEFAPLAIVLGITNRQRARIVAGSHG